MTLLTFLPPVIEQSLSIIAGLLLVAASYFYIRSVVTKNPTKKITPRPLSWFGWTLMMGITLISQVVTKGVAWNQIGLFASTVACLSITVISVVIKNYTVKPMDWVCVVLGIACVAIYLSTQDAWLTTVVAIIADFIVAIPTIHNAIIDPSSEKTPAWTFGVISWSSTLIVCIGYPWLYALFPIYLFLVNATMILLTNKKVATTKFVH